MFSPTSSRRSFVDQVVVITGGAGGIGAALAHEMVRKGAKVALLDRDRVGLDAVVAKLPEGRAMGVFVDVCDEPSIAAGMAAVCSAWGGIDVLINNAGISHRSLFAKTESQVLRKVMEVNFFGSVGCTRAALASITKRRGLIIAISSVAGFAPLVGRTGYCASKHALHGFFNSLRTELSGSGVDVMIVCPSFIATNIEQRALNGAGSELGNGVRAVAGAVMLPEEAARMIVAAASRRQRLVTPSAISRGSLWMSRLAPRVYDRLMLRRQGGEFT